MDGSNENGLYSGRRGSVYMQIHMPNRPERPTINTNNGNGTLHEQPFEYNPTDWVQRIINTNRKGGQHKAHSVFCELDVLKVHNDAYEWRETARWVKYEENLEEGGKRWSKPHVASLSMHSLFELRCAFVEGNVTLDHDVYSMANACDKFLEEWQDNNNLDSRLRPLLRDLMLANHKHSHVRRPKASKSSATLSDIADERMEKSASGFRLSSSASLASMDSGGMQSVPSSADLQSTDPTSPNYKPNMNFMRKIPKDAEAANVMVGEVDELTQRLVGFLRLKEPRSLGDMTEVALPTRFIVFILGPKGTMTQLMELGRCISTMMVDEIFRELAYKCLDKEEFLAGIDEFMEQVTVLPPGEWDPKIRLEPPSKVPNQHFRRKSVNPVEAKLMPADDEGGHSIDDPALMWSKIPFKGLVDDIKRKVPTYLTDYKDAIHIQCLASFVYVFLGTLTPNVTFGGLLGQATDQYMGVMECIFAAAVTGILFALFGGQPLNILGSTGPMLVLETIIYDLCKDNDWDFMPARFWVGMWTVLFILIIVIFNLSACVKYITRFTEDSFATLIAVIFIVEAFKKLFAISEDYPVHIGAVDNPTIPILCSCNSTCNDNITQLFSGLVNPLNYSCDATGYSNLTSNSSVNWPGLGESGCSDEGGIWECAPKQYGGDVFFFSVILFCGTFGITVALIYFKTSSLLPNMIRTRVSDFSVLIAIISMVLLDYFIGLDTPKLLVPDEFKPTRPGRGWIVSPWSDKNPWWLYIAAAVPAALSTILIFLDQQITAVIVNRKEHKLQKGVGYHLDMFVVAITVGIHSLLGLPWYVAATVSALAHVRSLQKESECTAPGEKPVFLGVREQRVTALFIGILSGLAVLITSVLKIIPMPVLYGVFFYMGFSALRGQQFIDRLILFFQPRKYQPDVPYIRHVQLWRIHMFTLIQVLCLVLLWIVKSIKAISIAFPLLVLATGIVRKMLECVYTNYELKYLDDVLPGADKHDKQKEEEKTVVPYKTFSSIDSVNTIDTKENGLKPSFYVDDECDLKHRQGNTKL